MPILTLDRHGDGATPRNFRDLRPYGMNLLLSAQFSASELKNITNKYKTYQIIIIDLREETHGFLDDIPFSIFAEDNAINFGKTSNQTISDELSAIQILQSQANSDVEISIMDKLKGIVHKTKAIKFSSARNEQAIASVIGIMYHRIPITDHMPPSIQNVDKIISIIKNLRHDQIIYAHCMAGKGRTSTFSSIMDTIHNAKSLSLEQILKRQYELGGADLFGFNVPEFQSQYFEFRLQRLDLLKNIYSIFK